MNHIIRACTKIVYQKGVKPILFKIPPDIVHSKIVSIGRKVQRSRLCMRITKLSWSYYNPKLTQYIHRLYFANPVGLAAGFDKNIQLSRMLENIGFGFFTGGSVTGQYCEGNPRPWFYRLPAHKALVVHAGLANRGSSTIRRQLENSPYEKMRMTPLSISVARTNSKEASTPEEGIEDYIVALKNLHRYPDMFEINISCPNTYGGEPFTTPHSLEKLLSRIDSLTLRQPVFIKMPSDLSWNDFRTLLKVIIRHDIKGVTICNLEKDRQGLSIPAHVQGGISGLPVQKKSDELIRNTYKEYGDRLTIIGVGGIFTAEDAYRKIKNGASLVGMVTGLIYEGPQVVGDINRGLVKLLEADGYNTIADAVGVAVR